MFGLGNILGGAAKGAFSALTGGSSGTNGFDIGGAGRAQTDLAIQSAQIGSEQTGEVAQALTAASTASTGAMNSYNIAKDANNLGAQGIKGIGDDISRLV